jgi:hypothetical protein
MATYIPVNCDPQTPPPYTCNGVTIQSFRLPANLVQQQLLVDQYLNSGDTADRGFYYQACMPFVDMDFVYYANMSYDLPPYSNLGSISQNELYFKIYVVKFIAVLDVFWLPVPAIMGFFPYMFVDNSWSMIAGREVSGFPKLLASFAYPAQQANQPLQPYPIQASTLAFNTIGPGAQAQMFPFVTIQALAQGAPVNPRVNNNWTLSSAEIALLNNPAVAAALASGLTTGPSLLRTVQLKQFRTAGSSTDACFQGIVEGQFSVSNLQFLNPQLAQIDINSYVTLSIAATLGLGAAMPIYPISQYAATCDLLYSQEATIFEYQ